MTGLRKGATALFEHIREHCLHPDRLMDENNTYLFHLVECLNTAGLSLGGASLVFQTQHPQIEMLVHRWRPKEADEIEVGRLPTLVENYALENSRGTLEVYLLTHGHSDESIYRLSPFYEAQRQGRILVWDLTESGTAGLFPIFPELCSRGETAYMALPIPMPHPHRLAMSLSTVAPGGFPHDFLEVMTQVLPYIRLSLAYRFEHKTMTELLAAYLGRKAAVEVAGGRFQHQDLESIEAVIGFIDLRGFTALTEALEPESLLQLMGSFYSEVDAAVTANYGDIMKFIGDAVLIVFPCDPDDPKGCEQALNAMVDLRRRVVNLNRELVATPIRYAGALHRGRVHYGNIGAPLRLDFTVTGSAVHLAARLQEIGAQHDRNLVLSPSFVEQLKGPFESLGFFEVEGFKETTEIFLYEGAEA